jgi:hypothetical protein
MGKSRAPSADDARAPMRGEEAGGRAAMGVDARAGSASVDMKLEIDFGK